MVKTIFFIFICLFLPYLLFAQTLQEAVVQAKAKYSEGSFQQASLLLASAASTYATNADNKTIIADAYNEIGEREYAKKNYANAYECYRKAVMVFPTHKAASQNFWKMKQDFDVANLKNEGKTGTVVTDKTTETDTERKLREAEAMIKELQKTDGSTSTARTSAQADELKRYQEELEKQRALIAELQSNYSRTQPYGIQQDTTLNQDILDNLVKLYQVALTTKGQPSDTDILAAQMKEYRNMFQDQQSSQTNLLIVAVAVSSAGVIVVVFIVLLIVYLIVRKRQKERFAYATNFDMGLGYSPSQPLSVEEKTTRLLGYEPPHKSEGEEFETEGDEAGRDAMKYMIRAERLKEMQNEKKYGTLKWETLRKYISELEKDLRSDILYVVESKINSGEVSDLSQVLPVLFPFLTDSDDYLQDKARHLIMDKASQFKETKLDQEPVALIGYEESAKKSRDPLSLSALMRHVNKLQNTKTARREHCISTAKYARGIGVMIDSLSPQEQELLYKAALVHDIGYLLLDKDKLDEVESKKDLSDEEFKFIHQHSQKGVEYFKDIKLPQQMKEGILYHHERNDGSGYPKGLKKDEIPVFGKIIGIADAFDALTTNRVFRDKMSCDSAIVIMKDLGRIKFEPEYLNAFIEYLKKTGKIKQ
jgi:putative nucleotidyltransferase with HDIG domain